MLFDPNRSGLNKRVFVVAICPMSFLAVPIAIMVLVPISVIPVAVTAVLVSSGGKGCSNDRTEREDG